MEDRYHLSTVLQRFRENWPEIVSPQTEAVISLMRLNDILTERFNAINAKSGFSEIAFEVLVTLRSCGAPYQMTPTDLYSSVLCTSGGMTKAIKHLEDEKLVSRLPHETDGRSMLVQLTEVGVAKAEELIIPVVQGDKNVFADGLSEADVVTLNQLIQPLIQKLEEGR